ncbi:MAG: class I SAM-dependent methyltransferase [Deltaproteobacteria bacterium]|nr:class I SAM-dependent methyltransferase [Deltaproteobacteria bacterium]
MSRVRSMSTPVPWDLLSSAYADEVVPLLERYATDALRLAAPVTGARIVDVACGPGTLAILAAQQGHLVDAIDFSAGMIERFEARRLTLGLDNVTAQVGDGQALPFRDATYGAGFSMFGLMFFADRAKGFSELRRVLLPGARAVVSSWQRIDDHPVLAAVLASVWATAAIDPDDLPLSTPEQCREEMSASFADVEVIEISHTERYETAAAAWASLERTLPPLVLMRRELGDEKWAKVSVVASETMTRTLGDGPPELVMSAWLTVGVAR